MAELDKVHLAMGDVVSRRYEIEEELGSGLLGVTYKARHISSGKFLAIKVLKPSLIANPRDRSRFEQGFARAKALRHDGLVRYGELGEHNGLLYFTQEYFPSQSLRQILEQYAEEKKSFSFQEASKIVLKVLQIVGFLHKNDLIHRNLKPENVLINTRAAGPGGKQIVRTVKITDTGLADMINPTIFAESYVSRTEARYLAPEMDAFDEQGQPASDVFSIGVMYYELLVGQTPRGTYLSPSQMRGDLPEYVDNIVEVAIGAEPEDRYPSSSDMITDIMRVFDGEVFDDQPKSNYRNILMGIGVVAACAAGLAIYFTQEPPEAPQVEWAALDEEDRSSAAGTIEDVLEEQRSLHQDMVYIPSGEVVLGMLRQETGTESAGEQVGNPQSVHVEGFYIDRYEYPNRLPSDCDGDDCEYERPSMMTYSRAEEACEAQGKQLCTAVQWEKACRGPRSNIYPYGDEFNAERCGDGSAEDYLIDEVQFQGCVSDYGVRGMTAGPAEWTSTESGDNLYVVKGDGGGERLWGSRCAYDEQRRGDLPTRVSAVQFRCCLPIGDVESDED